MVPSVHVTVAALAPLPVVAQVLHVVPVVPAPVSVYDPDARVWHTVAVGGPDLFSKAGCLLQGARHRKHFDVRNERVDAILPKNAPHYAGSVSHWQAVPQ